MKTNENLLEGEKPKWNQEVIEFIKMIFAKKQSNSEINQKVVSTPNSN